MKVISLNTWGGRAGKTALLDFFTAHQDVDVFCLQEIWSAPYPHLEGSPAGGSPIDHTSIMTEGLQDISSVLKNHTAYFRPHHLDNYGLLILVKKHIQVIDEGDTFVYRHRGYVPEGDVGNHARNLQYITVATELGPRTILNFHGLWNGMGKGDSADRLSQSARIITKLESLKNPYVLCGDFNLKPDTESLKILEGVGLRNLIKEFNIASTRTKLYEKPEKFADYALVSEGIEVQEFKVLDDVVSDHSPLYLEFS